MVTLIRFLKPKNVFENRNRHFIHNSLKRCVCEHGYTQKEGKITLPPLIQTIKQYIPHQCHHFLIYIFGFRTMKFLSLKTTETKKTCGVSTLDLW